MLRKRYSNSCSSSKSALVSVWPKHRISTLVLGTLVTLLAQSVIAAELDYCAKQYPSITSYKPPPNFSLERREKIDISANKTESGKDGSSSFMGDVVVERHELRIRADNARFDNTRRDVSVSGNVHIDTPSMSLDADNGRFFLDDRNTEFSNIQFFIPESRLR